MQNGQVGMSKRRSIGDVVWKRENAGFVGSGRYILIAYGSDPCMNGSAWCDAEHCQVDGCCHDDRCIEWHESWILNAATLAEAEQKADMLRPSILLDCKTDEDTMKSAYLGLACHVSECEMLDDRPAS